MRSLIVSLMVFVVAVVLSGCSGANSGSGAAGVINACTSNCLQLSVQSKALFGQFTNSEMKIYSYGPDKISVPDATDPTQTNDYITLNVNNDGEYTGTINVPANQPIIVTIGATGNGASTYVEEATGATVDASYMELGAMVPIEVVNTGSLNVSITPYTSLALMIGVHESKVMQTANYSDPTGTSAVMQQLNQEVQTAFGFDFDMTTVPASTTSHLDNDAPGKYAMAIIAWSYYSQSVGRSLYGWSDCVS